MINFLQGKIKESIVLTIIIGLLVVSFTTYKLVSDSSNQTLQYKIELSSAVNKLKPNSGHYIIWELNEKKTEDNLTVIYMPEDNNLYPYEHELNKWYAKLTYTADINNKSTAEQLFKQIQSDLRLLIEKKEVTSKIEHFYTKHTVDTFFSLLKIEENKKYSQFNFLYYPFAAILIIAFICNALLDKIKKIKSIELVFANCFMFLIWLFFYVINKGELIAIIFLIATAIQIYNTKHI